MGVVTTYDVHFRDRETITVEADHYEIDRDATGRPLGYEFLRRNSAPSSDSIVPVRVLYASAGDVVAIELATSKTASGEKPKDVGADAVEAMIQEFGKFVKGWGR